MKLIKYILLLFAIGFLLNSCMMTPDLKKSEMTIPNSWLVSSPAADSSVLKWWEVFNDTALESIILKSLEHNKDVLIAAKRLEQARAYWGMTKADLWPSLNFQAGAQRGNYGGGSKLPQINNQFYVVPALSWELDFWGKYRSLSASAQADVLASEWGIRGLKISLVSNVAQLYFEILDYSRRLEIAKKTVELRANSLKIIEMRFKEGILPEIDFNQAQAQWATASATVPTFERALAQTQYALSILLGENPKIFIYSSSLDNQFPQQEIPVGLPSGLLQRRPDILQAEAQLMAQNYQWGAAIAARFPSISITGLLGVASNDLSTLTTGGLAWSVGAGIVGPIFNFGKNKRRAEAERIKMEEMALNYEKVVLQAFREVEDALISVKTYEDELKAREFLFAAIQNAAKLSAMRYDMGVTSYLEVLENERSAFEAELVLSEVKQKMLSSYVDLYKSLGGGWISPDEAKAK